MTPDFTFVFIYASKSYSFISIIHFCIKTLCQPLGLNLNFVSLKQNLILYRKHTQCISLLSTSLTKSNPYLSVLILSDQVYYSLSITVFFVRVSFQLKQLLNCRLMVLYHSPCQTLKSIFNTRLLTFTMYKRPIYLEFALTSIWIQVGIIWIYSGPFTISNFCFWFCLVSTASWFLRWYCFGTEKYQKLFFINLSVWKSCNNINNENMFTLLLMLILLLKLKTYLRSIVKQLLTSHTNLSKCLTF